MKHDTKAILEATATLSPRSFRVLLGLEWACRKNTACYYSNKKLCDLVGYTTRTLQLCLDELQGAEWIWRKTGPAEKRRFAIVMLRRLDPAMPAGAQESTHPERIPERKNRRTRAQESTHPGAQESTHSLKNYEVNNYTATIGAFADDDEDVCQKREQTGADFPDDALATLEHILREYPKKLASIKAHAPGIMRKTGGQIDCILAAVRKAAPMPYEGFTNLPGFVISEATTFAQEGIPPEFAGSAAQDHSHRPSVPDSTLDEAPVTAAECAAMRERLRIGRSTRHRPRSAHTPPVALTGPEMDRPVSLDAVLLPFATAVQAASHQDARQAIPAR